MKSGQGLICARRVRLVNEQENNNNNTTLPELHCLKYSQITSPVARQQRALNHEIRTNRFERGENPFLISISAYPVPTHAVPYVYTSIK